MSLRTVTVNLPEMLYQRAQQTAAATDRSLEEVLEQSIALSLPPLEDDLPVEVQQVLAALTLMSDDELWRIARSHLAEDKAERLEALIARGKEQGLTEAEATELQSLTAEGELVMLRKAESYRLLTRRGYSIPWINR